MAPSTVGLAVLDFGGPQGPEELAPFLTELLADVLPLPSPLSRWAAQYLGPARAKRIGPEYASIGWSPLVPTHRAQVAALLGQLGDEAPVCASGMMFTAPTMREAVDSLVHQGVGSLIALPMFPHFSLATTGAAFGMFYEALEAAGKQDIPVHWIGAYFDDPHYIRALASTIRTGIEATPGDGPLHLVFTPHGLPVSFERRRDPYPDQIRSSVRAVIAELGWTGPWHLGWQSKVGPARWLTPSTPDVLTHLAAHGAKRVTLVPISFAAEHIETLFEIDVQYREHAVQAGIPHFGRAPALTTHPDFVSCLAGRVRHARATMSQYSCVRCLLPRPQAHRRRSSCPNCSFRHPSWMQHSVPHPKS
jgi:protoporphyrin/coproporphyrin ferrochelatase